MCGAGLVQLNSGDAGLCCGYDTKYIGDDGWVVKTTRRRANTEDNERRTPDVVLRPDECDASDVQQSSLASRHP